MPTTTYFFTFAPKVKSIAAHISALLGLVILIASLLPTVHAIYHDSDHGVEYTLSENLSSSTISCELCDFHFSAIDQPSTHSYDLYVPIKETVYSLSLAETVNLFPQPLFSLRAPPVVTS